MPAAVDHNMPVCRHIETGINLERLTHLSKSKLTQCEACVGKGKPSQRKTTRLSFPTQQSCQQEEKWVCLACGHVACDPLLNHPSVPQDEENDKLDENKAPPEGHAWGHFIISKHPLAMQTGDNNVYWCFICEMTVEYPVASVGSSNDSQPPSSKNPLQEAADVVRGKTSKKKGLFKDSATLCYTMEPVRVVIDTVRSVIDSAAHLKVVDVTRLSSSLVSSHISGHGNKRIVKGLINLGNTCFFNSVLQNLFALDVLRIHFNRESSDCEGPLTSSLRSLFQEMSSEQVSASQSNASTSDLGIRRGWRPLADGKVCNPVSLFDEICARAPRFRGFRQQDCHELLRCLLEGLNSEERGSTIISANADHREVSSAQFGKVVEQNGGIGDSETVDEDKGHRKPGKVCNVATTLVGYVFGGQLCSTVNCLECGYVSVVYEAMLDMSLQIPSKKNLKKRQTCEEQDVSDMVGAGCKESLKRNIKHEEQTATLEVRESHSSLVKTDKNDYLLRPSRPVQANGHNSNEPCVCDFPDSRVCDTFSCTSEAQSNRGALQGKSSQEDLHCAGLLGTSKPFNTNSDFASDHDNSDTDFPNSEPCVDLDGNKKAKCMCCKCTNVVFDRQISSEPFQNNIEGEMSSNEHLELTGEVRLPDAFDNVPLMSAAVLLQDELLETATSMAEVGTAEHDHAMPDCSFSKLQSKEATEISETQSLEHIKTASQCLGSAETVTVENEGEKTEAFDDCCKKGTLLEMPNVMGFSRQANCGSSDDVRVSSGSEQFVESKDTASSLTLEECLADFVKSELLQGENAWECEKCSKIAEQLPQARSVASEVKLGRGQSLNQMVDLGEGSVGSKIERNESIDAKSLLRTSSLNFERTPSLSTVDGNNINTIQNGCAKANMLQAKCSFSQEDGRLNVPEIERKGDSQPTLKEKSLVSQPPVERRERPEANGFSHASFKMLPSLKIEKLPFISSLFFKAENTNLKADKSQSLVKRRARKKLLVCKLPLVLTIHLKRFAQDFCGRLKKLSGHVAFSEYLNLQPFIDPRSRDHDDCIYRLVGIVEHSGTMSGGHYVAYVRCPDREKTDSKEGSWCLISDSAVSKRTLDDVLKREAYLLFYERQNGKKGG